MTNKMLGESLMDINIQNNIDYYKSEESNPCDCGICKIYYKKIKEKYPKIAEYLESLSVDVLKPFELSWVDLENGEIEYILCQYIVFGRCEEDFIKKIDGVKFNLAIDNYPNTNLEKDHFVLEFGPIFLTTVD